MKQFVGLKAKIYRHLRDNNDENKEEKGRKKCVIKKLKFEEFRNCLGVAQF